MEILKAILFGIVEGVTEWLPISSTGHIILLEALWPLDMTEAFYDFFEIAIQLGAILAVIFLFFRKLNPFSGKKTQLEKKDTWSLWFKVVVAVLPSAILGYLVDEKMDRYLRNHYLLGVELNVIVVAVALILYGVAFLLVERRNRKDNFRIREVGQIDYKTALLIGAFQCLSIIPGTSRSGATILGAILLGVNRPAGAEFSFFLAIPTMLGASALKLLKFLSSGLQGTTQEWTSLAVCFVVSFVVSLLVIKTLMNFVRKHSFASFGWYRIALGAVVLGYFLLV